MFKIISSAFFFSLISASSCASETLKGGVLQAYWASEWNAEGTVNTPHLGFRYLTSDRNRFIAIAINGEPTQFIKNNFKNIPDNFFTHKEWYVNQAGNLTIDSIKTSVLCNASIFDAKMIHFSPNYSTEPFDTVPYEETALGGCNKNGRYPYIITYLIKEGLDHIDVKAEPNDNSETIEKAGPDNDIFIKIKTIDNDWIYTGYYNAASPNMISRPRGYVRINQLEIEN